MLTSMKYTRCNGHHHACCSSSLDHTFVWLERKSNCWFYSWLNKIKCNRISWKGQHSSRVIVTLCLCPWALACIVFYCWFTCNLMVFLTIAILIFHISISTFWVRGLIFDISHIHFTRFSQSKTNKIEKSSTKMSWTAHTVSHTCAKKWKQ